MTTAREYLASKGLAIAGSRGKFSKAAHAELSRVMSEGMKFSDWPKATAPVSRKGSDVQTKSRRKSAGNSAVGQNATETEYISPSDFRFPEDEYVAKGAGNKRYSMRECCNNCKVSLTNHFCDSPTVLGETVTIVRR